MSVYKLLPTHYIKLHGQREAKRSFTDEQFENLKLLLKCSNSKLTSLAQTVRDLRRQLQERDETIAMLTTHRPTNSSKYSLEVLRLQPGVKDQAQNLVVDVSSDMQVQLQVEYVDENAEPAIKVASSVVTRPRSNHAVKDPEPVERDDPRPAPGPVRKSGAFGEATVDRGSPFYSSLMWRTRQRAKEKGYRFVWSRCGKILVKKDVHAPPMYILDEGDLVNMT